MYTLPSFRSVALALLIVLVSASGFAQVTVGISVRFGPPALPVYVQPPCPAEGFLWVPGYWAWDRDFDDYFWVPGTWVLAPEIGFLWTPGYWAWGPAGFFWNEGYWGPVVGFYGGIAYGFGYFGNGYEGGRWDHDRFYYNTTVNNVTVTNIHNVYNTTVVNNSTTLNRVSYNGGEGGVTARPTPQQEAAARERHLPPVAAQTQHVQTARSDPQLRATANQGKPPIAATPKPNAFRGSGVVAAREAGAPYHPSANRVTAQPNSNSAARQDNGMPSTPVHAADLPPHQALPPPATENATQDQKYLQQQQKLQQQQEKEHQKLQQQQEKDHQQLEKQQANEAQKQQTEQMHQQQTQQMEQRHAQQQQQLQQRQAPPPHQSQSKQSPPK